MLYLGRNNFAASRHCDCAEDCKIVRLGATAGKNYPARVCADDRRDLRARSLEHPARALTRAMHRRRISSAIGQEARKRRGSLDAKRTACVMIEINHLRTLF